MLHYEVWDTPLGVDQSSPWPGWFNTPGQDGAFGPYMDIEGHRVCPDGHTEEHGHGLERERQSP